MQLGFIGLGKMGAPMARRLMRAGHHVVVADLNQAAVDAAVRLGAVAAATPRAVADICELVAVSLPSPAVLQTVALGPEGLIHGALCKRVIDLSTTGSRVSRQVAAALEERGLVLVDAPVSGGVSGAGKGTLAVMVACPTQDFGAVEPFLGVFGRVFHVGTEAGMGQTMKLLNNYLSATAMASTAEAMVFGAKSGLDPEMMVQVINAGSGRTTASQDKFPRSVLTGTFDFGFTNGLMYKDVKLFTEEAEAAGVQAWIASTVRQVWQHAVDQLGADVDFTRVVQPYEAWAGVEVRARTPPTPEK